MPRKSRFPVFLEFTRKASRPKPPGDSDLQVFIFEIKGMRTTGHKRGLRKHIYFEYFITDISGYFTFEVLKPDHI